MPNLPPFYGKPIDTPLGYRWAGHEVLDCLDRELDSLASTCEGSVEYRTPLSGTGVSYPRCEKHWAERLDAQERINRDYPDSPFAPAWFDEANAGETWDYLD